MSHEVPGNFTSKIILVLYFQILLKKEVVKLFEKNHYYYTKLGFLPQKGKQKRILKKNRNTGFEILAGCEKTNCILKSGWSLLLSSWKCTNEHWVKRRKEQTSSQLICFPALPHTCPHPPCLYKPTHAASSSRFAQLMHYSLLSSSTASGSTRWPRCGMAIPAMLGHHNANNSTCFFSEVWREWNGDCLASVFRLTMPGLSLAVFSLTMPAFLYFPPHCVVRGGVTLRQLVFDCVLRMCPTNVSTLWKRCALHL